MCILRYKNVNITMFRDNICDVLQIYNSNDSNMLGVICALLLKSEDGASISGRNSSLKNP